MGKSLYIIDREIDIKNIAIGIPWKCDAAAYNMKFPEKHINITSNEQSNWTDQLGNIEEITTIFIGCQLNKKEYEILNKMNNIEEIYIAQAIELDHIEFILDKVKLRSLYIEDSKITDLKPLLSLMNSQQLIMKNDKKIFFDKLQNVAIVNAEIEELSCFCGFKGYISDLNLHGNKIVDLTPLENTGIYYADFSKNHITDISNFMNKHRGTYLMDFTDNDIEKIDLKEPENPVLPSRFFLGGNRITDYSIFKEQYFVDTDIPGTMY